MSRPILIHRVVSLRYLTVGLFVLLLGLGFGAGYVRATPSAQNLPPPVLASARVPEGQIAPGLLAEFQQAGATAQHAYWVILAEQADTRNDIPLSRWADKGWYVSHALTSTVLRTQPAVRQQIGTLQTTRQISNVPSFWIINSFVSTGDLASAKALAVNPAVAQVREPGKYHLFDTPETLPCRPDRARPGAARRARGGPAAHPAQPQRNPRAASLGAGL